MKTLNIKKALSALLVMLMLTFAVAVPAFAAGPDDQPAETAASQSAEAAQAEAEGKIRTSMMLTLVFIETAIIYALLVAILIIFVL